MFFAGNFLYVRFGSLLQCFFIECIQQIKLFAGIILEKKPIPVASKIALLEFRLFAAYSFSMMEMINLEKRLLLIVRGATTGSLKFFQIKFPEGRTRGEVFTG